MILRPKLDKMLFAGSVNVESHTTRFAQLLRLYQVYLTDTDTAAFVSAIGRRYSISTLERLAASGEPIIRRASALALGLVGSVECNQVLGPMLMDQDRRVRLIADDAIKSIWSRAGSPRQRQQLSLIFRQLQCGKYVEALRESDDLIAQQNQIPEAFSQRALAKFYLEEPHGSIEDCQRAIDLNSFHYLAWIGMGHSYLELCEPIHALECFRNALKVYPDLEAVRVQVRKLERAFQEPR